MLDGCIEFGHYPKRISISSQIFEIVTKPDLESRLHRKSSNVILKNGWIFPSQVSTSQPERIFGLNETHDFRFNSKILNKEIVDFLVWCLGYFYGMRLTISPRKGYVDTTSNDPGKLVDFDPFDSQLADILMFLKESFDKEENRLLLISAINTFFWGQSPLNFQFESFNFFYMAIDAIFRLDWGPRGKKEPAHKDRLSYLCQKFQIKADTDFMTTIIKFRNDLSHEAQMNHMPMGYSIFDESHRNILLKLRRLVCRLIMCAMRLTLDPKEISYLDGINRRDTYRVKFLI